MKVEVWSDVVCPWCYIGKRRLESALERFPHRDEVEVVWRSFQLDPSVPEGETHPTLPALAAKYGRSEDRCAAMHDPGRAGRRREGLEYHLADGSAATPCSRTSCCTSRPSTACATELKERLLHAHFEEGRPVFDVDSLVPLAVEVGLDEAEARAALTDRRFLAAVQEDAATAQSLGATGVPFFVVDRKYGAAGAQPAELLLQILERAWADSPPAGHGAGRRRLRRRQLRRLTPRRFATQPSLTRQPAFARPDRAFSASASSSRTTSVAERSAVTRPTDSPA